jgi:hypothetical protein
MTVNELIQQLTFIAEYEGKGDYPVCFDGEWDTENERIISVPTYAVLSYAYPGEVRIIGK